MKKVVLLLILALLVGGCTADTVAPASKKLPIYSVAREDNKLSISFDAAWGTEYTRDILDILDQYEIKTTFSWSSSGWKTRKWPEIVNRGHELGNHSATHPQMETSRRRKSRGDHGHP